MRKFKGIIFMLVFSIVFSYLAPIVKAVENYSNTTEKTTKTQQTQQVQKETEKEEEIQFASEELKARLVNEYDTNGDGKLVPSEVKDVTKLSIYWLNNEPTDILGIENFVSLEEIDLTNCKNFQILTQLPKLKVVGISGRIDAEELKQLENIKLLNAFNIDGIEFNELDISNLADRLEKLSISNITNINLKRLQNFSKLTELDIRYVWNGIAGLDMINNFTSLKKLQISDCSIVKDIEFLRNNSTIEDLDIHGNSVEDLSPIETMSNLKNLNCYSNNIKDISILETSNLINSSSNMQQSLVMNNVLVEKGKKTEIELPQTIRKAFDETSRFYMKDAELVSYNENSVLSVNSDKTKVTIDATQMDIGTSSETLYLNGNGALSNTSLTINFYVVIDGDKNQEIQFKSDKLKQYLLEHDIDIDGDNKITAFDMAQIRTLNLMWLNEEKMDLQGLEYATSLESLNVENAINYNVLTGLQNLKSLYVREIYYQDDYNSICNLQNLQELTLDDVDFVDKYDFNQLPKTLEKLEIQSSKINNIERINEFTNLNELRILWLDYDIKSINGLEKINELQNLKRLKLSLNDCKIENVDFLRDNESIEELDISDNAITNIDALETMKNLKGINISNNNIQDLSVVKRLNLQTDEYYSELYQNLKLNVEIEQGESTEIELPQLIKDMMNPDDEFYLSNLQISRSARFDDNSIEPIAKLNDENTKIILAPTTNEIGKGTEEFNFYGGGKLSSTSITINYTILGKGDKNKEVQFEDEYLKKQLEDYDNDGKITEFDMAQIKRLYLNSGNGIQNLKGLEYAKNLKELRIYIKSTYIDDELQPVDLSILGQLTNLTNLSISGNVADIKFIENLTNLTYLNIDFPNNVKNIESMKKLNNLKRLEVSLGDSEQIYIIKDMTNLESLSISGKVNTIEPLVNIANLKNLEVSGVDYEIKSINGLEKINELQNLTSLRLCLGQCKIENVDFLNGNESIEKLDISYNDIDNIDVLETMKNLKSINISGNNIKDLGIIKKIGIQKFDSCYLYQNLKLNVEIEQSGNAEIELPQIIKDMMNPNDELYLNNLQISRSARFEGNDIEPISTINAENTKIILTPITSDVGNGEEEIYFGGDGRLDSTRITINYTILGQGDKNKEVQFEDECLKQQLTDYDNDGKITEYDMAQIGTLNLKYGNRVQSLKGLEYAKNLKELRINIRNNYINGQAIPVDVSVLGNLTNLTLLEISGSIADLKFIENLTNLTYLDIDLNSDIKNIETIKSLENVKKLYVSLGNSEQINIIKNMENLEFLCVSGNVTTIEPLVNIANLKTLEISEINYEIKSINGLEKINELQNLKSLRLSLGQCKIENVDFLNGNESIEELDISENAITNIDILETMKNLKSISIRNNNIQDLSIIKRIGIQKFDNYSVNQSIKLDAEIGLGESIEIDLPQLIKDMMNPNDKEFYLENLRISHSARFEHNDIEPIAKINDEKTKIILAPTTSEIGDGEEILSFYGDGRLDGTSICINYTIRGQGDKNKEVQFEDEYLKQQLQACDYDNDGKITEYDMAQIRKLNLRNGSGVENLKGLEYAKNLKELRIYIKNNYINGQVVPVDLSILGSLTTLNLLDISGTVLDIKFLENLTNLTDLDIYLNSDVKNAESITKLENLKSLSVSLGKSEQIELIKGMTTLENLNISGQIETLEPLINLTKLRSLDISGDFQQLKDLSTIAQMNNLGNLCIRRYTVYNGEAKKFDYSFLKNLSSLYSLTIEDKYLNLDCAILPNSLNYLYLTCNKLCNTEKMEKLSKLSGLNIGKNQIKDIEFVKKLKLNWLDAEDNLITDISPLEYCSATYVNLVNNPINTKEEKNSEIIELYKKDNKTLNITDLEKTKNIDFENEEFKQKLVKEYDLNRDGEISIYEIEKIEYLYLESYIEKVEYLTNLKRLSFSNINLSKDEQEKLIKELDKLNSNVEVGISLVSIDLGKIKQNTTKEIDLNESVPLLAEMQKEGSRLYQGKIKISNEDYYNEPNTAEYKNNKLILNTSIIGERIYAVYYEIEGKQYSSFRIEVKWSNVTDGDKSKEISIKDANFKKALLENYDIDGDKKFTENDAVNIGTLEISGYQIESLSGIENFKNLYSINAYNNYITDITPVMGLKKLEYANFYSNNITDITCLKNRKFKLVTALGIDGNYLDFSNNSVQVKTYLDEMQKDISKYGEDEYYKEGKALLASFATSQKIGKPTTQNNEVKMDSKIKAKLISLGADLNKDGKLTPKELRDATQGRYENGEYIEAIIESVDLSNLGLTSVEGIQYLSGLKEINLSHNKISDLTPLSYMMNLEKIDLSYNNITDISKLPNYAVNSIEAKTVNLSHNQIKDISCVKNWVITNTTTYCGWQSGGDPNFRVLDLDFSYNKIEDISAVKNYKTLAKLNLSHNNITDISNLKDYNFLLNEEIEEDNEWSEIREDLSNFKGIDLSSNYIDLTQAGNKKAIQAFKNRKVEINAQNQRTKLSFKDVPENEWYYSAVKYVYEKKIILGYNTTTFAPNDKITRGMLVTILYRMEGSPKVTTVSKFSDVQNTKEYYYKAVNWAAANNIVSGYSDPKNKGKFGPDDKITREQLAVILWKYSRYKGKYKAVKTDFSKFSDSAKISEYAKNGMNWVLGVGVMHGSGGKLNPQGTATRAEAAAMLSNYCKNVK